MQNKINKIIQNNQFRVEVDLEDDILKVKVYSLTCSDYYYQ